MSNTQVSDSPAYTVRFAKEKPELAGQWNSAAWSQTEELTIKHFHAASSDHRPCTRLKLLYDQSGLYAIFDVQDRFVRCVQTEFQGPVYTDSCVELFLAPKPNEGYFNFEFNCGGTLLLHYSRVKEIELIPVKSFKQVDHRHTQGVRVYHSLPKIVEPELQDETNWQLECFIPFVVFVPYIGELGDVQEQTWKANFFKCGDATSHPHWASWAPIGSELNFHQPRYFAPLFFSPDAST